MRRAGSGQDGVQGSSGIVYTAVDLKGSGTARASAAIGHVAVHRREGKCTIIPADVFAESP